MKYILTFILLFPVFAIAQTNDTLQFVSENQFLNYREMLDLPDMETELYSVQINGYADTIAYKNSLIVAFVSEGAASLAYYADAVWKVWDINGEGFPVQGLALDTVLINDNMYIIVNYQEGEGNAYYEWVTKGIQIWNIEELTCMLNVTNYVSKFYITADTHIQADGSYPDNDSVDDCECQQQFDFSNEYLKISPIECITEPRFDAKEQLSHQDCMEEYMPGIYRWDDNNLKKILSKN